MRAAAAAFGLGANVGFGPFGLCGSLVGLPAELASKVKLRHTLCDPGPT